jgi:uncharacterized membrane protein YbhN (UPF0104 family)
MSPARKRLLFALKAALAAVVIAAVAWHFYGLLTTDGVQHSLACRVEYLLPAGLLYLACHTLWGTFWWQLLRGQGVRVGWLAGVRAYFVSQWGKYVPGKALVILLRVGLLKGKVASPTVVIVTGTYETLTNMAAGAVLGACLLPVSDQLAAIDPRYREVVPYSVFGLAFVPLALFALNRLIRRVAARYRKPDAEPIPVPSVWLVARGMLQAVVGWCLLGLSAWLVACGLSAEPVPLTLGTFAQYLCAVCVAYLIGFAALFLPAGGGLRELVLQWMLSPPLGAVAAAVAVVLRVVWTLAEAVAAVGLYLTPLSNPPSPPTPLPQGERGAGVEVPA